MACIMTGGESMSTRRRATYQSSSSNVNHDMSDDNITSNGASNATTPASSVKAKRTKTIDNKIDNMNPHEYGRNDVKGPIALGVFTLALAVCTWVMLTPIHVKLVALIIASAFALIEASYYVVSKYGDNHTIVLRPVSDWSLRNAYTTLQMWGALVIYTPILIHAYRSTVHDSVHFLNDRYGIFSSHAENESIALVIAIVRVLFYPLDVWVFEILSGYWLKRFYKRAWFYEGPYARMDGLIRLDYFVLWWGLGIIIELTVDTASMAMGLVVPVHI